MLIFILGYMGSGKSTVGKKLASKLGYEFLDMDMIFERNHGTDVAAYFAEHGEASFREQEKELLSSLVHLENTVVSTGGGTPCFFDNMQVMNDHGITIYMDHEPKALYHRLIHAKIKRPLLQDYSGGDLLKKIRQDLLWRASYYRQATHIIRGKDLKYSRVLEALKK
jgi:shikimate kinase